MTMAISMGMGMGTVVDHGPNLVESIGSEYPHKWANILTGPLSEGAVSTYLEALYSCITDKFVPSPMIVQSLLYFTLHPPSPPLPAHTPTPLSILYKIASLHPTTSLMAHNTLPVYPREREKLDIPDWLYYETHGDMEKSIKKRMKGCVKEGIWDLVWVSERRKGGRGKRKRGIDPESEDGSEREEEEVGRRKVSERGWLILEWLVHIWGKDQDESGDYSTAFLAQLPKQGDMQIDNPTLPLQVLYSVLNTSSSDRTEGSGPAMAEMGEGAGLNKEEQCRRERTAGRLAFLLINTANPISTTKPPFHPSTLTLSLLPLFRVSPLHLQKLLSILSSACSSEREKGTLTHFLVHGIEDTAGIRSSKMTIRRTSTSTQNDHFVNDNDKTNFPRPTIKYMFEVLLLPPLDGENKERMGILKLVLVATLLQIDTHKQNGDWGESRKKSWRREFKRIMDVDGGDRGVRRMIMTLLDKRVEQ